MELDIRSMDRRISFHMATHTNGFLFEIDGIVAFGGALRDLDTGRVPKDYDFLVPERQKSNAIFRLLNNGYKVGRAERLRAEEGRAYTAINEHLKDVYTATKEGYKSIDILIIDISWIDYLEKLPINSSCIAFGSCVGDGISNNVIRLDDYYDFLEMDSIVISDNRLRTDYLERLRGYYPNHTITVDDDCSGVPEPIEVPFPWTSPVSTWFTPF
jgi:hypothetical protein